MAIEKQIKTKISLRYLDYATWSAESFKAEKPLKGEVWFCAVPQGNASATTAPTMLFKVGDGVNTFGDLKWCSALAADVYDWAKKPEADFIAWVNSVVEHPAAPVITTGGANGTIAVDGTDVAVKGLGSAAYTEASAYATSEQGTKADNAAAAIATYGDIVTHNVSEFAPHDIDTGVHSVALAGGTNNGTLKLTVDGQATDNIAVTGLGDAAYTTVETLNATAKGYADAVEAKIPTSADYGVLGVTAGNDTITIRGTAQNPTIAVTAKKFDAYGAASEVQFNLTAYEELHASDYTNAKIDELVQEAKTYADNNDANTEYHVEYDSTNKKIKLVAGADASKMEIDATDFIKDGMIDTVTIGEDNDLVITFNTAAGKDEIRLPLDQLVDIYTGHEGARIVVTVSSDKSISAELVAGSISKNYLDAAVQTSLGLADSALQAKDLAEYAKTENVVTNEEFTAFEATNTEAIGKKLDKATYDAYIAGKELSDAELKKYADDEADAAETAAKAYVDEKTAGYAVDADGNIKIAPTTESNYDSYISVAHGDNSGGVGLISGDTSITMAGDAHDININASTIRLSGTVSIEGKEVATQEYVQNYAATAEQGDKADTALQNITTTENGGLKISTKENGVQNIDIDTDVVFVLDCNW